MKRYKPIFENRKYNYKEDISDKFYEQLSDGSEAFFVKGEKDPDFEYLINLFGTKKPAATLENLIKIGDKLKGGKYTKELKKYIQDVAQKKKSHPDAKNWRFFEARATFIKSVFLGIVQALFYHLQSADEEAYEKYSHKAISYMN